MNIKSESDRKKSIWQRRTEVDRARMKYSMVVMEDYDTNVYRPAKQALAEECEQEGGHNWQFRDTNPLGYPIYDCTVCGTTKIERTE